MNSDTTSINSRAKIANWPVIATLAIVGVIAVAGFLWLRNPRQSNSGFTDELRYMPKGCQFVVSIDCQSVLKSKAGSEFYKSDVYKQINKLVEKLNDDSDLERLLLDGTGLKLAECRRITVLGSYFVEEYPSPPNMLVVFKMENSNKFRLGLGFARTSFTEEKLGSYTIFTDQSVGYCIVNDSTVVFGAPGTIREVLRRDGKPEVSKTLQASITEADFTNPVAGAFDLKDVVDQVKKQERQRRRSYSRDDSESREEREVEASYQSETSGLFDWFDGAAFKFTLGATIEGKATLILKPEIGGSPNVTAQIDHRVVLKLINDGLEVARAEDKRYKRKDEIWEKRRKSERKQTD